MSASRVLPTPSEASQGRRQPKISVKDLSRDFASRKSTVHALGPLDLEISDGEFVCIVGPSGCGKSTLLRILAGLVKPTSGQAELHGLATDQGVAVVFQDYSLFPWKTVEANVRFGLEMAGITAKGCHDQTEKWMTKLGLIDFRDAYPSALSGGMRQRVSIARALVLEPEILLMDEPFAALDAQLRHVLQDELLQLWQELQRTVVFITHNLDEAILLGDRVVLMGSRPGRVVAEFDVPFPRPRSTDVRGSAGFAALEAEIWDKLRSEVEKTMPELTSGKEDRK